MQVTEGVLVMGGRNARELGTSTDPREVEEALKQLGPPDGDSAKGVVDV